MSVSTCLSSPINLSCNEEAGDALSLGTDISEIGTLSTDFSIDEESSIVGVFDSELDQMLEPQLAARFLQLPGVVAAYQDAVNWMLKVHAYYPFSPETAYLSVNYLRRFLSSHTMPQGRKGWPLQLLAVACLSLAAKMEETSVPLLIDLQILEPRFLFKPNTVQRMELLVMANLKWRLHITTPFYFLHYFIVKLSHLNPNCNNFTCVLSRASDLIVSTCRVINFFYYTPSTIAAAALLWVTNNTIDDDSKLKCFHKRLNKEMVKRCYNLIKQNLSKWPNGKVHDEAIIHGRCHAIKKPCNKDLKSNHDSILLQTSPKN